MYGAIDLGGTKIEAALLDNEYNIVKTNRISTPLDSYDKLLSAIDQQVKWIRNGEKQSDIFIGIGVPGFVDKDTGEVTTSNLPAHKKKFRDDILKLIGENVLIENDCRCFALSEANGGAGAGYKKVFGLIVGTGIGGGMCIDKQFIDGLNGMPVEIGHIAIPAFLANELKLPILKCGCGRMGCYETLVSGHGLSQLADYFLNQTINAKNIVKLADNGDEDMQKIVDIWLRVYSHMLDNIQLLLDPDCIVLGGGTSLIPKIENRLATYLKDISLKNTHIPKIYCAKYGDSSGVRGAAMLAQYSSIKGL